MSYEQIKGAIAYIHANFKAQPGLEQVAAAVHMSPSHFQKTFKNWAGISPKQFLQFTNIEYAKSQLRAPSATLLSTSLDAGLSSTSRLHDLFIRAEGMTPGEFKKGGEGLTIYYQWRTTLFGQVLCACTTKGVCYLAFDESKTRAIRALSQRFPHAALFNEKHEHHTNALSIFSHNWQDLPAIKLHLSGTPFQLKVWESLIRIPFGTLCTYGQIANNIQNQNATRAVGTAIGQNPISFLIPCHRVIQSTGNIGGYMWGPARKTAMIGWEAATLNYAANRFNK